MKITRYGTVTLTTGPVKVEGWRVEREADDPPGATTEQLLLSYAIQWAKERFKAAEQGTMIQMVRKMIQDKIEHDAKTAPPEPKAN